MTPQEAKFDGAKGFQISSGGTKYRIQLKRGKETPGKYPDINFKEQLIWVYPDNEQPRLLWCNEDNQWFDVTFNPIEKP